MNHVTRGSPWQSFECYEAFGDLHIYVNSVKSVYDEMVWEWITFKKRKNILAT